MKSGQSPLAGTVRSFNLEEDEMMPLECRIFPFFGIVIFLSGCFLTGCGYYFRATGEPLGIKIESIAIPMIESTSSDIGFEADFTKIIREEFISHAKVPLLSMEEAQTALTGEIYDIRTEPLSYNLQQQTVSGVVTTFEVTKSRRLKVKLDMRLTDRSTGKVIWHEKAMAENASFEVDEDPLVTRFNQQQALESIARQLAKRIFLKTMERF